jgi:cellobiose phosphorylase
MVARAHAEAGNDNKVWRVIDWISSLPGGASGSWFERYGPSITPPAPPVGIVGWIWYEIMALYVHQIIGLRPGIQKLVIRPRLISGLDEIRSTHIVRGRRLNILIRRSKEKSIATVDGREAALQNGALVMPYSRKKTLDVELVVSG